MIDSIEIPISKYFNFLSYSGGENQEMYRNSVPSNSFGMQHSTNLVNGHHEMQMSNFSGSPGAIVNGYGMSLKQEPDVNY